MEPKYTSTGMPIISEETLDSTIARYDKRQTEEATDWGLHLMGVRQRILREGPVLTKFLEMQVGRFPREEHDSFFEVLVGLYAIIEHQIEANKLGEDFGL